MPECDRESGVIFGLLARKGVVDLIDDLARRFGVIARDHDLDGGQRLAYQNHRTGIIDRYQQAAALIVLRPEDAFSADRIGAQLLARIGQIVLNENAQASSEDNRFEDTRREVMILRVDGPSNRGASQSRTWKRNAGK